MVLNDQEVATNFVRARSINSFQKLLILLLLVQDPNLAGPSQQFVERLNFDDPARLNRMLTELGQTGVIVKQGDCYQLDDHEDLKSSLAALVRAFDDPAGRRQLLDQVAESAFHTYRYPYQQRAFQAQTAMVAVPH